MAIVGPALGYVVGGQLLLFYTDFLSVDPLTLVFDYFYNLIDLLQNYIS